MEDKLTWKVEGRKQLLKTRVFDVNSLHSVSPDGVIGDYVAIDAPCWVNVIPVDGDDFLMVRQYRHGLGGITMEFPGGVADEDDKTPEETAYRELLEETGYKAGTIVNMGSFNPNPALFSNKVSFCIAENLVNTNKLTLDEDECLTYERVPIKEVFENLGKGEYIHAFLGTALMLYLKYKETKNV